MEDASSSNKPLKSLAADSDQITYKIIPASKWLRFANLLIDYIGFMIFAMLVGVLVAMIFGEKGVNFLQSAPDIIIGVPVILGYYIIFEAVRGRTLGKLITGTKVVNETGLKPTFGQIIGRSFLRFVPFEALSFLGKEGRGWHDRWSKSYVVKCR